MSNTDDARAEQGGGDHQGAGLAAALIALIFLAVIFGVLFLL